MEKLSVKEILQATSGELISHNDKIDDIYINSVCIDSRDVKDKKTNSKSSKILFVPIIGEKVDAHQFIPSVFESGAELCLSSKSLEGLKLCGNEKYNIIKTSSTLEALQNIAKYYRSKFNIPVIGVTGSSGKTSTKDMIYSALSQSLNVLKTKGNQNSTIGLPLSILNLEHQHEAAVIEMGISEFGEMSCLAEIAKIKFAVITNIGFSHIANLGSQDNILKEKLHITDGMPEDSIVFINGDDRLLANLQKYKKFRIISFGTDESCIYRAENIILSREGSSFDLNFQGKKRKIVLNVPGKHNIYNALAAFSVGINLNLDADKLISGIANYTSPPMRQNIYDINGIKLIDDSYNANPDSMKSGIDLLNSVAIDRNKILLCADMLELGDFAEQAHREIGEYAAKSGISHIIALGELSENIVEGALKKNPKIKARLVKSTQEAYLYIRDILKSGDVILVKGSRGMHLEDIVKKLLKDDKI